MAIDLSITNPWETKPPTVEETVISSHNPDNLNEPGLKFKLRILEGAYDGSAETRARNAAPFAVDDPRGKIKKDEPLSTIELVDAFASKVSVRASQTNEQEDELKLQILEFILSEDYKLALVEWEKTKDIWTITSYFNGWRNVPGAGLEDKFVAPSRKRQGRARRMARILLNA